MSWALLGTDQDASPPGKTLVAVVNQLYRDSSYLTAFIYVKKQFLLFCSWHQELQTSDFFLKKKLLFSLTQFEGGYLPLSPPSTPTFFLFSLTVSASL